MAEGTFETGECTWPDGKHGKIFSKHRAGIKLENNAYGIITIDITFLEAVASLSYLPSAFRLLWDISRLEIFIILYYLFRAF